MFINTNEFLKNLKKGPPDGNADAGAVIDALFKDPDFKKLWNYLAKCPKVKIKLKAGPVVIDGIQRYGGYGGGELTINPKYPAHMRNPQELAETLIHELIHAVLDLRGKCGEKNYPLPAGVLDLPHDKNAPAPKTRDKDAYKKNPKAKAYMDKNYGDSDSAPKTQYADENIESRKYIAKIIKRLIAKTKKGKPTKSVEIVGKLKKP